MSRLRVALGAVALATLSLAVPDTIVPAAAQGTAGLELVSQTASLRPGRPFDLEVRVTGGEPDHTVTVDIGDRVGSRIEFLDGLQPGVDRGTPIYRHPPATLAQNDSSTDVVSIRVRTRRPDQDREDAAPLVAGVYPVQVVLTDGEGNQVDELITHLLAMPSREELLDQFPLDVTTLAVIDAPVALQPDRQLIVTESTRAAIDAWAESLTLADEVPVTLRVPGETVDALFRAGTDDELESLEALQRAVPGRDVLIDTFVPIDAEAWRTTNLRRRYRPLVDRDLDTLTTLLEGEPDEGSRLITPTDTDATLDWLAQERELERLIVTPDRLGPLDPNLFPLTLTRPFVTEGLPAVAVDEVLTSHFGATGNAVLDAHRTLADLTVLAYDQPNEVRGAVLAPPADWAPDATMLSTLLTGIARSRVLRPVTLTGFFDDVPPADSAGNGFGLEPSGQPLERPLVDETEPESLGNYPAELLQTEIELDSFATVVGEDSPLVVPLTDLLVVSGADQFDRTERAAYLDTVQTEVDRAAGSVHIAPSQTITLTSREADVPLQVDNRLGVDATVRFDLASEKLEFPDGESTELVLAPGESTVEIPVRARTSGDATFDVVARSPDDRLQLGPPRQVRVRSTVLSGLGIVISIAALLVLLTWWARQIISHRRARSS